MRPYVVSSSKGTATGTGATGITIDRPGGIRPYDVLYAFLSRAEDTGAAAFAAAGWTSLQDTTSSTGNDIRGQILRKVVTGSEPASYTFTNAAGDSVNMTGIIVCVRGANQRSPEDATTTTGTGSDDFTPAARSITSVQGHALILTMHGASMDSGTSGKVGGAPSGFTLIDYVEETGAANFESFLEVAYLEQTDPGASGTNSWTGTANDATSEFVTMSVAVRCGTPVFQPGLLVGPILSILSANVTDTLLGGDSISTNYLHATDSLLGADEAIGVPIVGDPIIFEPIDITVDVPGWTLALPEPLLFKAVEFGVHVPGWFVTVDDPMDEPMTADLFLLDDLVDDPLNAVPIVTFDLCTDPDDARSERAWDWLDMASDVGSGSIRLANNDPDIVNFDTDSLLAVGFNMYGMRVYLIVLEEDDAQDISDQDEVAEETRFTGRGPGVIMELGHLDPYGGPYRSPVEENRHFGWPDPTYDRSTWVAANVLGTIDSLINHMAVKLAGGLNENTPLWQERLQQFFDARWPTRDTPILGAPGASITGGAPVGDVYFYEEFTIAAAGDYLLYLGCDDTVVAYVDSQQVGSVTGINFFGTTTTAVTLSAGTHSIAALVSNVDLPVADNGLLFTWAIIEEQSEVAQVLAATTAALSGAELPVTPPTIIAQASGAAVCLAYPNNGTPGQSITKTLRIAYEETIARGYMPAFPLGFTDTTFSDGSPVIVLPDFAVKVGSSYLQMVLEAAETYIEWEMDPVTLTLNVWAKNERGSNTSVDYNVGADQGVAGEADAVTANLVSLRRRRERRRFSRFLVKWEGGWAEAIGTAGGGEAPLELGSAQSLDEIERLTDGEFTRFNDPRTQIDIGIVPEQAADAPYLGPRNGDRVGVLDFFFYEPIVSIAVATDVENPEDPEITLTLSTHILTPEERQARDLRSLL